MTKSIYRGIILTKNTTYRHNTTCEATYMTEQNYNLLWEFTKEHKNVRSDNPHEAQAITILNLYQDEAALPLKLNSAADVEEACQCIRMALMYAF